MFDISFHESLADCAEPEPRVERCMADLGVHASPHSALADGPMTKSEAIRRVAHNQSFLAGRDPEIRGEGDA